MGGRGACGHSIQLGGWIEMYKCFSLIRTFPSADTAEGNARRERPSSKRPLVCKEESGRAAQLQEVSKHSPTAPALPPHLQHFFVCLFICMCANYSDVLCLPICVSVCLYVCPSICVSVCLSIHLCVCMSVHPFVCLYVCPSIYLSVYQPTCLPACLSVCLYIHLSVFLSSNTG